MPIEPRSKLLQVINMKTAKALGLTVPAIAAAAHGCGYLDNQLQPRSRPTRGAWEGSVEGLMLELGMRC
jgi:hypothetical protein